MKLLLSGQGTYRTSHICWIPKYRRHTLNPGVRDYVLKLYRCYESRERGLRLASFGKSLTSLRECSWENIIWSSEYFVLEEIMIYSSDLIFLAYTPNSLESWGVSLFFFNLKLSPLQAAVMIPGTN